MGWESAAIEGRVTGGPEFGAEHKGRRGWAEIQLAPHLLTLGRGCICPRSHTGNLVPGYQQQCRTH